MNIEEDLDQLDEELRNEAAKRERISKMPHFGVSVKTLFKLLCRLPRELRGNKKWREK